MAVKVSDMLAWGLLGISIYILTSLTNTFLKLGILSGLIGSVITIIVESFYLINWIKRRVR